jgi:hypothetical protein
MSHATMADLIVDTMRGEGKMTYEPKHSMTRFLQGEISVRPLREAIEWVLDEWKLGCDRGAPGGCAECTLGALQAIELRIFADRDARIEVERRGPS